MTGIRGFEPSRPKRVLNLAKAECADPTNMVVLVGGTVVVAITKDRIRLRSIKNSWLTPGLRGHKEILISQLTGVQFRKTGKVTRGFIQFVFPGSVDKTKGSSFDAVNDENAVVFDMDDEWDFERLYRMVLSLMDRPRSETSQVITSASVADGISKLFQLVQAGAITQQEFEQGKRKILGSQ